MRVMLTPCCGERREQRVHRAGLVLAPTSRARCCRLPVGAGSSWPSTRKRVVLFGSSSMLAREHVQPVALARQPRRRCRGALLLRGAPRRLGVTRRPACARRSAGSAPASRCTARATARASTRLLDRLRCLRLATAGSAAPAARPRRRSQRRLSSRSSVRPTAPSVEFSTGTTANCAAPDSALRNASSIDARRQRLDRAAEMLAHRLLAERALGPEVGDADRLLQRAAGRDDLAEDARATRLGRSGPGLLRRRAAGSRPRARADRRARRP